MSSHCFNIGFINSRVNPSSEVSPERTICGLAPGSDSVCSAEKLRAKVGRTLDVIIDAVDDETGGATGRSQADAPEIDGEVHLRDAGHLAQGDIVPVIIEDADEHDLFGVAA